MKHLLGSAVALVFSMSITSHAEADVGLLKAVTVDGHETDSCTAGERPRQRVGRGGAEHRDCVVNQLDQASRYTSAGDFANVVGLSRTLADFYDARSDRQQFFLDSGAMFSGLGGLGYAVSEGAGVVTRGYWGYAGLLPLILVDFNANEPTRDLFFAGGLGLRLIVDRYEVIRSRSLVLSTRRADLALSGLAACAARYQHFRAVAAWTSMDDRNAVLPAVNEAIATCERVDRDLASLRNVAFESVISDADLSRGLANDLVLLDRRLTERDHGLRTTPAEAFTVVLSAPLRRLDSLISGEDVQEAVTRAQLQDALNGVSIDLWSPPTTPDVPDPWSETYRASTLAQSRLAGAQPASAEVASVVSWLLQVQSEHATAAVAYNRAVAAARDIKLALASRRLTFSYGANHRAEVALGAPGAQPPTNPAAATGAN